MRVSGWKSFLTTSAGILGIAVVLSAAARPPSSHFSLSAQAVQIAPAKAQDISLTIDPAQCKVHWSVDSTLHMVHGTFRLKSGAFHFDADNGKAGGEIVVTAASGESGDTSRDAKMQEEVLESGKYPEVLFRPTLIDGRVAGSGGSDVKVRGTFVLRGGEHEIMVPVHAELSGESWKGTGKFEVPYIQWGLKNPSNFLLKVQPLVTVELELAGSVKINK